jgi:FKBP-type peptidyl-prolyl cis-trans isomerase 2
MSKAKSDDTVKIHYTGALDDGNHSLAGQALTFAIELVEIA